MKRWVGGILVLVLAALAALGASSYWFGVQTEREYNAMIQRSAEWQHFKFTGEAYTRGVFGSEAKTTLELRNPPPIPSRDDSQKQDSFPFKVILFHKITHGPIPFGMLPHAGGIMRPALAVIETKVSLDPQVKELLKEIKVPENSSPTMDMVTVLKWSGEGDTHLAVHPYRGEFGEESKVAIDFSGLKSRIEFSPGFKQFKGSFSMDGFSAVVPQQGDFLVKRMNCAFNQFEGKSGFYLGDATYGLELIELKHREPTSAQKDFTAKDFTVNTQAQEAGNDLSSSATFALDQLNAGAESFNKAVFELEFRRLDATALSEFQKTLKELQQRAANADQISERTLAAFMGLLPKLLKNSPEVEIKQLGFASTDGDVRASARLTVDGNKVREPLSLPMLLQSAQLEAALSAAETTLVRLLQSMDSQDQAKEGAEEESSPSLPMNGEDQEAGIRNTLSVLVAQRFLVLENGAYKANVRYAGGQLNLNGQAISLDKLLGQ